MRNKRWLPGPTRPAPVNRPCGGSGLMIELSNRMNQREIEIFLPQSIDYTVGRQGRGGW